MHRRALPGLSLLGSMLLLAMTSASRVHAAPLYSVVDLGLTSSSPTIPSSFIGPRATTDAGAIITIPIWATTSADQSGQVPNGPIGTYAEFIFPSGNTIHIGLPDSDWTSASAVNDLGQAVGQSVLAGGALHAFLYVSGQNLDINNLLLSQTQWTITRAINIDDMGRILADALSGNVEHTVELVPQSVPEPSALIIGLFLVGVATLRKVRHQRPEIPRASSGEAVRFV